MSQIRSKMNKKGADLAVVLMARREMYLISHTLQRLCPLLNVAPCLHHVETTAREKMEGRFISPNLDVCGRKLSDNVINGKK